MEHIVRMDRRQTERIRLDQPLDNVERCQSDTDGDGDCPRCAHLRSQANRVTGKALASHRLPYPDNTDSVLAVWKWAKGEPLTDRQLELVGLDGMDAPAPCEPVSRGAEMIFAERLGHFYREGWTLERDEQYQNGELTRAARAYTIQAEGNRQRCPSWWPFAPCGWKPASAVRMLVKAGSLIAAEIDRRLRRGETE